MEKNTPHYPLPAAMQTAIAAAGRGAFTVAALRGGADMGLSIADMPAVIAGLIPFPLQSLNY